MMMIGRRNRDRVDFLADFVEQFAVVKKLPCFRPGFTPLAEPVFVDVAKGDHFHQRAGLFDVAGAFAADADARDSEALVRPVGLDNG